MKEPIVLWTPEEIQFLHDNHLIMSPQDMANELNFNKSRVTGKMAKLELKTSSSNYSHQEELFIQRLIKLGLERSEILEISGAARSKVDMFVNLKIYEEKKKTEKGQKYIHRIHHYDEIRTLKKMGLQNFKVDFEEDERWKYQDLSPSEKLIYHKLQTA